MASTDVSKACGDCLAKSVQAAPPPSGGSVLLPQPLGPTIAVKRPCSTAKSTRSITRSAALPVGSGKSRTTCTRILMSEPALEAGVGRLACSSRKVGAKPHLPSARAFREKTGAGRSRATHPLSMVDAQRAQPRLTFQNTAKPGITPAEIAAISRRLRDLAKRDIGHVREGLALDILSDQRLRAPDRVHAPIAALSSSMRGLAGQPGAALAPAQRLVWVVGVV